MGSVASEAISDKTTYWTKPNGQRDYQSDVRVIVRLILRWYCLSSIVAECTPDEMHSHGFRNSAVISTSQENSTVSEKYQRVYTVKVWICCTHTLTLTLTLTLSHPHPHARSVS